MYAETDQLAQVRGQWLGAPVDESAPMQLRVQDLEISHGVNLISLNVNRRWNLQSTRGFFSHFRPELGAGLTGYGPHAEGTLNGVFSSGDYQWAGTGYQIFAGGEYRLSNRLGLMLRTKFDSGKLNVDLQPDARLETHTRTVHGIGGLAIHFGSAPKL